MQFGQDEYAPVTGDYDGNGEPVAMAARIIHALTGAATNIEIPIHIFRADPWLPEKTGG